MLTAWLKGPTEINLWHGVADRARERDVNLICFSGGIPHWHQQFEAQKNILFDIAGQPNLNGLLVWANILSHTLDRSSMEAFCQRYAPLPVISMGMVLPSIPSIRIDMQEGMGKLLSHLIEVHGRRRIAFIRGPEVSQDAEERYQAYCHVLAQYGLPIEAGLVVPGDFRRSSGVSAVEQLSPLAAQILTRWFPRTITWRLEPCARCETAGSGSRRMSSWRALMTSKKPGRLSLR